MRRTIDSDQLRAQYDFKLFRGIPFFFLGLALSRLFGMLRHLPGMWILEAAFWAVLGIMAAPLILTAYYNIQNGQDWYQGFNPERLILLGIVAIAAITGIALELYRIGG